MSAPKVLTLLWGAITVPILFGLVVVSHQVSSIQPGIVIKTTVVTPTASPSATVAPTIPARASSTGVTKPVNKGGVK